MPGNEQITYVNQSELASRAAEVAELAYHQNDTEQSRSLALVSIAHSLASLAQAATLLLERVPPPNRRW